MPIPVKEVNEVPSIAVAAFLLNEGAEQIMEEVVNLFDGLMASEELCDIPGGSIDDVLLYATQLIVYARLSGRVSAFDFTNLNQPRLVLAEGTPEGGVELTLVPSDPIAEGRSRYADWEAIPVDWNTPERK